MKNIYLLGATGSIGTQTLDVIRIHRDKFRLAAMSVGFNIEAARKILLEFDPEFVSTAKEEDALCLQKDFPHISFGFGEKGLVEAATYPSKIQGKDFVMTAVMGAVGLTPTLQAIEKGRDIGIANKETLVTAGHLVMEKARQKGVAILPVDSEHSAIYQCLNGEKRSSVTKLIITASGGSFRDLNRHELKNVTRQEALNHPNWSMGEKITIDSATMMNKGLEVIEAHHLFAMPYEKIETLLHKQSVIHSMVEFEDTSVIAQLGTPDMRIPIQFAMSWPDRVTMPAAPRLKLSEWGTLDFKEMDFERFPALKMAYQAGSRGGSYPTVLNAANEVAVSLFLKDKLSFLGIDALVSEALNGHDGIANPKLEEILAVDAEVRRMILEKYN